MESGQSITDFTDDFGVPETLLTDGDGEFTGQSTDFIRYDRRMRMYLHYPEQGRYNQNHAAEHEIGLL